MGVDDEAMASLCGELHAGAAPKLQILHLLDNEIGDAGMQAFSSAIDSGSLGNLKELRLFNNNIGDDGMKAFSDAITSGAMVNLSKLFIIENPGDTAPVKVACRARGITCRTGGLHAGFDTGYFTYRI